MPGILLRVKAHESNRVAKRDSSKPRSHQNMAMPWGQQITHPVEHLCHVSNGLSGRLPPESLAHSVLPPGFMSLSARVRETTPTRHSRTPKSHVAVEGSEVREVTTITPSSIFLLFLSFC